MIYAGADPAAPNPQAVCLGETMAVLLPGHPGPTESVEQFLVGVGGAESNVACGLAGHGITTAWISRVGDDAFGRRITSELTARGVDVSAVTVDPLRPTGLYLKETHPHSRMRYYRTGSAASALGPDIFTNPVFNRVVSGARLLHLSGITPALSDSCLGLIRALLTAPRPGRTVSFDLNWRPALWRDRDPAVLLELGNAADLLFLGADEAEAAFGLGSDAAIRAAFPAPATVVVKNSEHHVTALNADGTTVSEPALLVEVVEPTGAGDAFAAGYLAATLRGLDQRSRLRLGHITAATALTSHGDHGVPQSPELTAALLAASPDQWAATRVAAAGIHSPALF
ncbi:sugar kinase [Embleya scabrispora]|uniref:sugar kinase n=1 Tax=Embleya scabrispora TaxID=159449 RepID=UPI0003735CD6|nr:sugar kinase [Embleya scabrispora]MYS80542.1 sugar kinase [Streptomyces sp. SID5474]